MTLRSILKDLRYRKDGSLSTPRQRKIGRHRRSHIAPDRQRSQHTVVQQGQWANMPPELLLDVVQRIETTQTTWPGRRNVVACASVCKSWREVTQELVKTPEECGMLTLPISLKQPGPRESPIQCFIKRERATSTYHLYLGLTPALLGENGKLLLSARKIRKATYTEFVISLVANDFARVSNTYVGKLRSNFLGTKFTIYDSQAPYEVVTQNNHVKQVSTRAPAGNYNIGTVSYELNVLRARGPRRMHCTLHSIPISSLQEGGTAPTPTTFPHSLEDQFSLLSVQKSKEALNPTGLLEPLLSSQGAKDPLVLKNKAPRWHEQLQCWCLNFRGRVTVASVKNFQLVAAVEPHHNVSQEEQEKVILQFGKIGKDIFTMDYRYPLSAFQAFAICLSAFDTKPACE